jgi:tRNA dimethylallyltransferase
MMRLYLIVGCTASGKGRLALELVRRMSGQIVSVDSMKVYRRMDIGTAKPSPEARAEVPHHLIDVVEPSEYFSAARYVSLGDEAVAAIAAAGDPVIAAGGTALYARALVEGLFEGPGADPDLRGRLKERIEREGSAALHEELRRIDPDAAGRIHPNDARRIVRALEVHELTGRPISDMQRQWDAGRPRYDAVTIGIRRRREDQSRRINARVKRMMEQGLREEVESLLAEPASIGAQAGRALGYAEMIDHLRGGCSLEEAVERIKINTRRLAKGQRTWWRRFPGIRWVDVAADEPVGPVADRAMEIVAAAEPGGRSRA